VNNAGFGTEAPCSKWTRGARPPWCGCTLAPMRLTMAVLPAWCGDARGDRERLSVASFIYSAGNVNYCATKAYLTTFTEGVAAELRGTGCRRRRLPGLHAPSSTNAWRRPRRGFRVFPG
jgi:short-subunit dehydrogenase